MTCVTRALLLGCLLSMASSPAAMAQSDGTFAVGAGMSIKGGATEGTVGHANPSLLWRFGHGRDGWGWEYGLSWYSADLQQNVGNSVTDFGELHVRPFMGGYGYQRRIGHASIGAKLLGGYAINSFELQPAFDDAYRRTLGARTVTTRVSNSFVIKPEVSAWFDVSRKIGINLSAGYVVARPEVSVSSSLGTDTRHIRADVFMFRVGTVYSVF